MITLDDGDDTIELHKDLLWSDEFSWTPVEQSVTRGITGANIFQTGLRTGGRPITLEPEADNTAWMTRETLAALSAWAAVPDKEMTLTLRGQAHNVVFRHQDTPIDAVPVVHYDEMLPADLYRVTFRFMEK